MNKKFLLLSLIIGTNAYASNIDTDLAFMHSPIKQALPDAGTWVLDSTPTDDYTITKVDSYKKFQTGLALHYLVPYFKTSVPNIEGTLKTLLTNKSSNGLSSNVASACNSNMHSEHEINIVSGEVEPYIKEDMAAQCATQYVEGYQRSIFVYLTSDSLKVKEIIDTMLRLIALGQDETEMLNLFCDQNANLKAQDINTEVEAAHTKYLSAHPLKEYLTAYVARALQNNEEFMKNVVRPKMNTAHRNAEVEALLATIKRSDVPVQPTQIMTPPKSAKMRAALNSSDSD